MSCYYKAPRLCLQQAKIISDLKLATFPFKAGSLCSDTRFPVPLPCFECYLEVPFCKHIKHYHYCSIIIKHYWISFWRRGISHTSLIQWGGWVGTNNFVGKSKNLHIRKHWECCHDGAPSCHSSGHALNVLKGAVECSTGCWQSDPVRWIHGAQTLQMSKKKTGIMHLL